MTTSHCPSCPLPPRIDRTDGRPVCLTQAGRVPVPLTLTCGPEHVKDLVLVLPVDEAGALHTETGRVLYFSAPPTAETAS